MNRWTKLSDQELKDVDLSPSERPMLGTIRSEFDRCAVHLKYLTGDSGPRTWRGVEDDASVEFAKNPFRVLAVTLRPDDGCVRVTEQDYASIIDAFLSAEAPDSSSKKTWRIVMHEALSKLLLADREVASSR